MPSATFFGLAVITASLLGCAAPTSTPSAPTYSQSNLPESLKVPNGHKVVLESVGKGRLTYECRGKAGVADQFEWAFVSPEATLSDRSGQAMGRYFGPPATWEGLDGSKVSGVQVAVAPSPPGNLAMQLVKVNAHETRGRISGFSFIQRVATQGGIPAASSCEASKVGQRSVVPYQADYIFWAAAQK